MPIRHHYPIKHPIAVLLRYVLGYRAYLLLLSAIVGVVCGLAGAGLRLMVRYLHNVFEHPMETSHPWFAYARPAIPSLGILGCVLFVHFVLRREKYEKGLGIVIRATSNGTGALPRYKCFSHLLTSGWAVGCGVSAGLEAPMALTGSAIGSTLAHYLKLTAQHRILLLACGGAAGISAMFNSPIAGTMFACEVLLPAVKISCVSPILMASATSMLTIRALHLPRALLVISPTWSIREIPLFLTIGLLAGIISYYVIKISVLGRTLFEKFNNIWLRAGVGCALLYVFFFLYPALSGEGYRHIVELLRGNSLVALPQCQFIPNVSGNAMIILLLLFCLLKPIVSAISLESGGDGGIFGPSLFIGATLGYFVFCLFSACGYQHLTMGAAENSIVLGMASMISGIMFAPLTGMFLIAEMTDSYALLTPLMVTVSIAFLTCRKLKRFNLYCSMMQDNIKDYIHITEDTSQQVKDELF